jgi:ribosomal protein L29
MKDIKDTKEHKTQSNVTSQTVIDLKKQLLLLRINSVVMDENHKRKEKMIKKAIAMAKAGRMPAIKEETK